MSQFTPRQVLQRQMLFFPIFGAAGIVAAWAWWAFQAYVKTPDPKATVNDAYIWLGIAAVLTVAVPIGLAWTLLQTRVLLQRGRMTTARLAEVGGAVSNGQQTAKFQYVIDGQTYT